MSANLKVLHLICACLFLGNVIVSGIWAVLAERTRNHAIIQFSNRVVLITDLVFTFLGSLGVVWTGFSLSGGYGGYAALINACTMIAVSLLTYIAELT